MSRRTVLWLVALLPACWVAATGGEPDPWLGEPPHLRHRMEELADAEVFPTYRDETWMLR